MINYHLFQGITILFVGINPHPGSNRRGVPFSNNKMFWYLLYEAGLLKEPRSYLKHDANLQQLYSHTFRHTYGYAIINMVDRESINISFLKKGEAEVGRVRLLDAIQTYKPKIVCFVGKITYTLFTASKQCTYGWKPSIGSTRIFVMHTPLRGAAQIRIDELKEIGQELINI